MKSLKNIICFILLIGNITNLTAQRLVKYTEVIKMDIDKPFDLTQLEYTALLPQTIEGKQEVLSIEYSRKPTNITTKSDNQYAYFAMLRPKAKEIITITAVVLLKDNDLISARKNNKKPEEIKLKKYLKHEANFQVKNKKVQEMANTITGETDEEIAKNIYQLVIDHMTYNSFPGQNRGAKRALKTGEGDCTEYSELMVTLCRAKGIPARIAAGVVVAEAKNPRHNWVEIYLKEHGWVAMDPTHGDHENAITTFENLENKYIYTSFSRFTQSGWKWRAKKEYIGKQQVKVDAYFNFEDLGQDYLEKATKLYQKGAYQEAGQLIEDMLSTGVRDMSLFVLRGFIQTKLGELETGMSNIKIAMALSQTPTDKAFAKLAFANYYNLIGEQDKAEKLFKKAIEKYIHIDQSKMYIWEELKAGNPKMIAQAMKKD